MDVAIAVHGGAGDFEMKKDEQQTVETLSKKGIRMLRENESAESVVEEIVKELESDSRFNAGIGSKLQLDGTPRPEAGIMNSDREIGCAIGLEKIENPVSVASYIMENLDNNIISSPYVNELARECGFKQTNLTTEDRKQELEEIKDELPNQSIRKQLEYIKQKHSGGTVGCVALDSNGGLCSATSTGGRLYQSPNRVGDSPLVGSGFICTENIAVSTTGVGEAIMKTQVARTVAEKHKEHPLSESVNLALSELSEKTDGVAGVIAVNRNGDVAGDYNTTGMIHDGLNNN